MDMLCLGHPDESDGNAGAGTNELQRPLRVGSESRDGRSRLVRQARLSLACRIEALATTLIPISIASSNTVRVPSTGFV